jgi:hypothetical protein
MLETRTAGDNQQVSEVVKLGDVKLLYRLKVDENVLRRRNVTARPTEFMKKVMDEARRASGKSAIISDMDQKDSTKKDNDFFISEFQDEKKDSTKLGKVVESEEIQKETVLKKARVFEYRPPKYFTDYAVTGFNNSVFVINKYQPYAGGAGPINLSNSNPFNGMIRMGTSDLMEDYKFTGGFRISSDLTDYDVISSFLNQRKRLDWGMTYYRSSRKVAVSTNIGDFVAKQYENYYLVNLKYPLDRVRSIRSTVGPRFDRLVFQSRGRTSLSLEDIKTTYGQVSLEYVYDNTLNPTLNIWNGLRYKAYIDWFTQLGKLTTAEGKFLFNAGFDARHYLPLYRHIIWAVRGAADFSWGKQKVVYYLGGVDNWLAPKFNENNQPDNDATYAYQSLAVNLRGFKQNVANGNNAVVINSEIRVPVFSTFFNKPINNAFLRNFQIVQFFDLGSAWNGAFDKLERPGVVYGTPPVTVRLKAGGIGPFAGGYGFGARSTLLGYFLRFDAAWEMNTFFGTKPMLYVAMGVDF